MRARRLSARWVLPMEGPALEDGAPQPTAPLPPGVARPAPVPPTATDQGGTTGVMGGAGPAPNQQH